MWKSNPLNEKDEDKNNDKDYSNSELHKKDKDRKEADIDKKYDANHYKDNVDNIPTNKSSSKVTIAMLEDIQLDYSHGKVNRVLTISQHFKKEYFDQYDDVIVMDNSKRKEYRKFATKAFLPSFKKIIKEKDFQTLDKKVEKFQKVIECHTTGILFIRDNGRGYNNPYRHHFESSRAYEIVCNNILEQWIKNFFEILKDLQERLKCRDNGNEIIELLMSLVYGSMLYILLQNSVYKKFT